MPHVRFRAVSSHVGPLKPFAFVPPTEPVLAETPPKGKGLCHEVKFDGFRLQFHKVGDQHLLEKRQGIHLPVSRRRARRGALPRQSCIIDAKGCALDAKASCADLIPSA